MFTHLQHDQMTLTLLLMWVVFVALVMCLHYLWFRCGGRLIAPPKAKYTRVLSRRFRRRLLKVRRPDDKSAKKHGSPD